MNPLLEKFNTPFETAPFSKIETAHYLPAIEASIAEGREEIAQICSNSEAPSFENTIEALEKSGEQLGIVTSLFFNLNSAETNDEMQALAQEISPILTNYANDITLNAPLFLRIKTVYNNKESLNLNTEQTTLLEKTYKSFVRNGALLNEEQKSELRAIDEEKSSISLTFGEHVLAENNKYELVIDQEEDLAGLPEGIIEAAALQAKEKGKENVWVFTLDYPSYIPFMTYAQNRDLREKLFKAYVSKCFHNDELDNQEIVKKIAGLRHKRANLLGYTTHAHFTLEERMAESPFKVKSFLEELLEASMPYAKKELEALQKFAKETDGIENLKRWDTTYYSEKLKKQLFSIDDELLKPYFQLEKVIDGVFETAQKLYGLNFEQNNDIDVYHEDVIAYEVTDESDKHVAVFYADFFPRSGKRQGAWMTSYRDQYVCEGKEQRPHVSIVCNFTKPTGTKPSLLTFNEVSTLFHEFGHALHGMLAKGTYGSLSGTNVYWDFVELPSQILENWCYEQECLDLFAKHYENGTSIPVSLIEKIKESANFQAGMATVRQLSFGLLDMAWHAADPSTISDVQLFEREATSATSLLEDVKEACTSCQFSHIFQGGYSAGYYSYKWAEVLDADAFEAFKEKGIFDQETANLFKEHVLSAGGKEHPSKLYKKFRGKEPDNKALLRRAGLLK